MLVIARSGVAMELIVQVKLAGVGSVLPAGSVARTWKVWLPLTKPLYVVGLVQEVKALPSWLQANVLPGSVAVNANVALVLVLVSGGAEVMFVSGAMVSMTQLKLAGEGSMFPAGSRANTRKVWLPLAKPL